MRYGIVGLRFVLGVRSDSGAKEMVAYGTCVGFSIVFGARRSIGRGARIAHGMLKRRTCW